MPEALTPDALVGSWALVDFWIRFSDGRAPLEPFGAGATGWLLYSASGRMSAVLSRADRAPLEVPRLEAAARATDAEKARAFDGYLSYAGRWSIEPPSTVVHHVTEALVPNIVGVEQRRTAVLSGDALTLSYTGGAKRYELRWRRS